MWRSVVTITYTVRVREKLNKWTISLKYSLFQSFNSSLLATLINFSTMARVAQKVQYPNGNRSSNQKLKAYDCQILKTKSWLNWPWFVYSLSTNQAIAHETSEKGISRKLFKNEKVLLGWVNGLNIPNMRQIKLSVDK